MLLTGRIGRMAHIGRMGHIGLADSLFREMVETIGEREHLNANRREQGERNTGTLR